MLWIILFYFFLSFHIENLAGCRLATEIQAVCGTSQHLPMSIRTEAIAIINEHKSDEFFFLLILLFILKAFATFFSMLCLFFSSSSSYLAFFVQPEKKLRKNIAFGVHDTYSGTYVG